MPNPRSLRALLCGLVIAVAFVTGAMGPAAALPTVPGQADEPIDCVGPVEQVEPGSPEWDALNVANAYCARERHLDKPAHTVLQATAPADAYREPTRHAGRHYSPAQPFTSSPPQCVMIGFPAERLSPA